MSKVLPININDLLVNPENYRFEPVGNQKDAIEHMIADQKGKLFVLASHIIEHGLNPNERIQVTPYHHDKSKYVVVEGNRRIVTLKLLANPDLIEDKQYASLRKKFQHLRDANKNALVKKVECVVYDNPDEANVWIKLKHVGESGGAGTVQWVGQQTQRFEERVEGKSSMTLQVLNLLKVSKHTPNDVQPVLAKVPITNLERLIGDKDVKRLLGIEAKDGQLTSELEEAEVVKGLSQVIKDVTKPGFTVNDIYTKQDRLDYVSNFPKKSRPDSGKTAGTSWSFSNNGAKGSAIRKAKDVPTQRATLIPKGCTIEIGSNRKTNALYHELKSLKVKYVNCAAVALRVFVELSVDSYIDHHKLPNLNRDTKLIRKVTETIKHMEATYDLDRHVSKGLRNAVNNPNNILGTETWNAYVHNKHYSATGDDLVKSWDNLEPMMVALWSTIK